MGVSEVLLGCSSVGVLREVAALPWLSEGEAYRLACAGFRGVGEVLLRRTDLSDRTLMVLCENQGVERALVCYEGVLPVMVLEGLFDIPAYSQIRGLLCSRSLTTCLMLLGCGYCCLLVY